MPTPKENDLPSADSLQLGAVFAALADPVRRLIVQELLGEPVDARRQCSSFGVEVSKSTMTHHFRILREAGLTIQYNHGNRAELELRRADLDARFPGLLDLVASNNKPMQVASDSAKAPRKRPSQPRRNDIQHAVTKKARRV